MSVSLSNTSERTASDNLVGLKYCRSCWRKDFHVPAIRMPRWLKIPLNLLTLGRLNKLAPSRCICCGTRRMF